MGEIVGLCIGSYEFLSRKNTFGDLLSIFSQDDLTIEEVFDKELDETHYLKAFIAAGIRNRIIALYDNDSAGLSEIKVLKNIPIPSNVRIMHLPDLEMCLHYPTIGPGGSSIDNINGRACSIEMFLGKDILKKSGEYEPVRWKSYIDKVDAYQGEIVPKSEVLKQFKLKVKRSQDQLVLDEWEECDLNCPLCQGHFELV